MNEERDVATATRPAVATDFSQPPVTPLARVEQSKALPQQQTETRTVQGVEFTRDQIELLKRTICKGATDDELDLFLYQCKRTRLDPFTRQCYFMKRRERNKDTGAYEDVGRFETSIDGLRLIAERTGKYAGQVPPQWAEVVRKGAESTLVWYEVWPYPDRDPYAARVGVLRRDFDVPLIAPARWDAYKQVTREGSLNAMWKKRGAEQLAKCAESLALRQAFPNEMSGVYTTEEMAGQDDDDDRDEYTGQRPATQTKAQPTQRRGTKAERIEKSNREWRNEPVSIFAGLSVSRYISKFPFGKEPTKGAALDQNQLTDDKKSVIEREYVVSGELLARAWDWCDKALHGKQTIDEIIDGKKTGKKLPVTLDAAGVKRFEQLKLDVEKEIERRQIERDEAVSSDLGAPYDAPRVPVQDNTAADDAREQLAEDKGEAYEGD
jgi:phage recombination protein Bet